MLTILTLMNVAAFILSFGAILWAWLIVHKDMKENVALLARIREIDAKYAREAVTLGQTAIREERRAEYVAVGKTMFTYGDMMHMPELVKGLIYSHAASGLGLQVALVGLGLSIGTVANIWSLYV
ncbi:hypothetical protein [Arthrobacter sp. Y81]|uniref:hypothetical protein n=1 Tax=Arthrobacter sp. Y81 TaxID=2058897 RepID=UPI000CE5686C|nr:hypothetical protein [Arthrobacter sp. Y81]